MHDEGDARWEEGFLRRRILVDGSSGEELGEGHPMRAGSSDGETPRREGAECKPLVGRQGGGGVLVSDGVGSGSLVTTLASCLPGLQLRHGLLAQEWTSRHEQGPQPATHRPAPQQHWSVPPHIPLAACSVPCPHTPVPWHTEGFWGSFSAPAGCSL